MSLPQAFKINLKSLFNQSSQILLKQCFININKTYQYLYFNSFLFNVKLFKSSIPKFSVLIEKQIENLNDFIMKTTTFKRKKLKMKKHKTAKRRKEKKRGIKINM